MGNLYFKMIGTLIFSCSFMLLVNRCTDKPDVVNYEPPVTHELWDKLLRKHVNEGGTVDYRGFQKDSVLLNEYLNLLSSAHPNERYWTREEQMAYWINTYNAFTVKIVAQNYPVASIKDIKSGLPFINSVWDIKFIKIQDEVYDLNNIEHSILREKFRDPRIHAAINCASVSCPQLRNEAYTAENLDRQLEEAMLSFVNDPVRNRIGKEKAEISSIFRWFKNDFTRNSGSLRDYLNKYSKVKISGKTDIDYLEYDWRLNDIRQ